jgi:hypothetical protein
MENMHSFMDDTFGDLDEDALVEHSLNIIMEVEDAFSQISEQGLDTRALTSSFSEKMVNHTKNLFSKEYEIDDLLRGYSYVP